MVQEQLVMQRHAKCSQKLTSPMQRVNYLAGDRAVASVFDASEARAQSIIEPAARMRAR